MIVKLANFDMRDYGMQSVTIAVNACVKLDREFKVLFMQMFVLF